MITTAAGKANCPGLSIEPGRFEKDIQETIARIEAGNIVKRIWDRDHTVWKPGPGEITNRLGWLTLPETMQGEIPGIEAFAGEIRSAFDSAVLLGMGGSSLAPEMFADIFGADIDFTVLDTTVPAAIRAAAQRLDPQKSLFIVSTKSGGTVETISLFRYFHHLFAGKGSGFAAITDPGSTLAATASQLHFRRTFLNDPDVGGRFFGPLVFRPRPGRPLRGGHPAAAGKGAGRDACLPPGNAGPGQPGGRPRRGHRRSGEAGGGQAHFLYVAPDLRSGER